MKNDIVKHVGWLAVLAGGLFCLSTHGQSFTFQDGVNGYTGEEEVVLLSDAPNRCKGDSFIIRETTRSARALLKFTEIHVPEGLYRFDLRLTASNIVNPGTVALYPLLRENWLDPHTTLDPPGSDSAYPTWSYLNHSSVPWETAGAAGTADRGPKIAETNVESVTTPIQPLQGKLYMRSGQSTISFLVQGDAGTEFGLYHPDVPNATEIPHLNPNLKLTKIHFIPVSLEGNSNLK